LIRREVPLLDERPDYGEGLLRVAGSRGLGVRTVLLDRQEPSETAQIFGHQVDLAAAEILQAFFAITVVLHLDFEAGPLEHGGVHVREEDAFGEIPDPNGDLTFGRRGRAV
jgi:hypothetical protein